MNKAQIAALLQISDANRASVEKTLQDLRNRPTGSLYFRAEKIRSCENLLREIDETAARLRSQLANAE